MSIPNFTAFTEATNVSTKVLCPKEWDTGVSYCMILPNIIDSLGSADFL